VTRNPKPICGALTNKVSTSKLLKKDRGNTFYMLRTPNRNERCTKRGRKKSNY
jgi:hypothetical protein